MACVRSFSLLSWIGELANSVLLDFDVVFVGKGSLWGAYDVAKHNAQRHDDADKAQPIVCGLFRFRVQCHRLSLSFNLKISLQR